MFIFIYIYVACSFLNTAVLYHCYRMVLSSPLFIVAYVMIWYVPDISKNAKPYWYLGFYCLFTISLAVSKRTKFCSRVYLWTGIICDFVIVFNLLLSNKSVFMFHTRLSQCTWQMIKMKETVQHTSVCISSNLLHLCQLTSDLWFLRNNIWNDRYCFGWRYTRHCDFRIRSSIRLQFFEYNNYVYEQYAE